MGHDHARCGRLRVEASGRRVEVGGAPLAARSEGHVRPRGGHGADTTPLRGGSCDAFPGAGHVPAPWSSPARSSCVTGASRGIGRAIAEALIARGATVAAAATSTERARASSAPPPSHAADLGDPANALALAEEVEAAHGRVDVLINNAGVRIDQLVTHAELEDVDRSFQVNVISPYVLAGRLAAADGRARRGRRGEPRRADGLPRAPRHGPYASSKAALESLTNTLRQEVGGKGVAVFGFDPGWVRTDLAPDGKEEPGPVAERLLAHLEAGKGSKTPLS